MQYTVVNIVKIYLLLYNIDLKDIVIYSTNKSVYCDSPVIYLVSYKIHKKRRAAGSSKNDFNVHKVILLLHIMD